MLAIHLRRGHRAGSAGPRSGGRPRPFSTVLGAAYLGAAVLTGMVVLAGGTRHPLAALIGYLALTATISAQAALPWALAVGATVWLFYDGFIVGRHAVLAWSTVDGLYLAVLIGVALLACATGYAVRRTVPGRPEPTGPASGTPWYGLFESGVPGSGLPEHGLPEHGLPEHGLPEYGLSVPGAADSGVRESGVPEPTSYPGAGR